ncbi:MAG: sugar ABC transporter ATP-binding protein [Aeromicrobium sp.]
MSATVLAMHGVAKSFGAVQALRSIDFDVRSGEIVGLLGQNGSGKSTLVKILTGYYEVDAGRVELHGQELESPVKHAHRRGIVVIHQDLALEPTLSVLDNVGVVDGYARSSFAARSRRAERKVFRELVTRVGIDLDPDTLVSELSPAQRVFVAVIRALRTLQSGDAVERPLILFDEPTALLPAEESLHLIAMMRRLADAGAGIVFITHRLAEVMGSCDRAAVIRDGSIVFEAPTSEVSHDDYIEAMLGRRMESYYPDAPAGSGTEVLLSARGITGSRIRDLDLDVHAGEIVGVTGLVGMGQEELPLLLSGAHPVRGGSVRVRGTDVAGSVRRAVDAGVAMVPSDRRRDGIWMDTSVLSNMTLPVLDKMFSGGFLRGSRERSVTAELMTKAGVHPPIATLPMSAFSGGNQQKVVFAKWMNTDPCVLLLDEPTQGVDAGAKRDLLEWIVKETERGLGVVMASGDHEQVAAICSRVIVLHDGEVVCELRGDEITQAAIISASSGLVSARAVAEVAGSHGAPEAIIAEEMA